MRSGFYLLHRGIFNHHLFAQEKFTEREAWIWLIENASFEPHKRRYKNRIIEVNRGQVPASLRILSEQFQWSVNRIQRFLNLLEQDGMISKKTDTGFLIITICNYEKYQDKKKKTDTVADTQVDTLADTEANTETDTIINKSKQIKTNKTREASSKISLDDLSVFHLQSFIVENNLDAKKIENALPEFKDHWRSTGKNRSDWIATFRNFARNDLFGGIQRFKQTQKRECY